MAPVCEHCEVSIIGQGVEAGNQWYCCAREAGKPGIVDRV